MFNILVSCSGRQVFLIDEFKKALGGLGKVIATDFCSDAPSLMSADIGFKAPSFTDTTYLQWMESLVKDQQISMIVSLNVEDLIVLETARKRFSAVGCRLVGGDIDKIELTLDKFKLNQILEKSGLPSVFTILLQDWPSTKKLEFPLIAKPRYGKGSRGIMLIQSEEEFAALYTNSKETFFEDQYILQTLIPGEEYGFDVINDLNRKFVTVNVRKKVKMMNGETNIATTVPNGRWLEIGKALSEILKHEGTIDVDAMLIGDEIFVIDVNFRFGGGYIFSHFAGSQTPKAYVLWGQGKDISKEKLISKPGFTFKRLENGSLMEINNLLE